VLRCHSSLNCLLLLLLVTDVLPESAASKIGLKHGDIITKFGGEIIDDTSELNRLVAVSAKTTKSLSYERDGKEMTVSVLIPEVSEPTIIRAELPRKVVELLRSTTTDQGVLGVSVQTLTPDLASASSSGSVMGVLH
jgi:membrane-associated protease RseP (regulator of RpoE activity)